MRGVTADCLFYILRPRMHCKLHVIAADGVTVTDSSSVTGSRSTADGVHAAEAQQV